MITQLTGLQKNRMKNRIDQIRQAISDISDEAPEQMSGTSECSDIHHAINSLYKKYDLNGDRKKEG